MTTQVDTRDMKTPRIWVFKFSAALPAAALRSDPNYSRISLCQSSFPGYRPKRCSTSNSLLLPVVEQKEALSSGISRPFGQHKSPSTLLTRATRGVHSKSLHLKMLHNRDFYFSVSGLPSFQWPFPP
jgi:hypothetical protein